MRNEKKNLCKKCGGKCCKKSGCDYFVSDFLEINEEVLIKKLDEGETSIVGALYPISDSEGYLSFIPFLYLRARNIGRDIVDILSFKRQCMLLTDNGCPYPLEKRPGGGAALIPQRFRKCYRDEDPLIETSKWEPYQQLLSSLVVRYSGMSVDEIFKRDIEQVLYETMIEDFAGIDKEELNDMLQAVPLLATCFPKQYNAAKKRAVDTLMKRSFGSPKTSKTLNLKNNN